MPVGAFSPSQIHIDYPEWQAPGAGDVGKVWAYTGSGYAPVSLAFDPSGTATAAISNHLAASNPHSQYYLAAGVSVYGATLISGADATAVRTTLGLSAMATATESAYLLANGSRAGATAGRQVFTNGITTGSIRPTSDSTTTAVQVQTAGGTAVVTVDTVNQRLGVGVTPDYPLHVNATLTATNGSRLFYAASTINNTGVGTQYTAVFDTTVSTATSGGNAIASKYNITVSSNTKPVGIIALQTATNNISSGSALSEQIEWQTGPAVIGAVVTSNLYHAQIRDVFIGSGGSVTNQYGIYVQSLVNAANNYAIYTNGGLVRIGDRLILSAATTLRSSATITAGTAPTTPNAGDIWYPTGGRLSLYRAATEIFATGVQVTGGAATAGASWTSAEQAMLQKIYDAGRAFGLLS